jgi:MYXO-CTERM domain-containing protein
MRAPPIVLCCLLGTLAASTADAALLVGDAEATVTWGRWWSQSGSPAPFGLAPHGLVGTHASIRFTIDTDLLPPDDNSDPLHAAYFTFDSDPSWLHMSLEINGIVRDIGFGERAIDVIEGTSNPPGQVGDDFVVNAARNSVQSGQVSLPEYLRLEVIAADFGDASTLPTYLSLTGIAPIANANVYVDQEIEYGASGEVVRDDELELHFNLDSLLLYPVPEPGGVAWLALGALALLRPRRVSR